MSKKLMIIISIIGVILVAGIVTAVLVLTKGTATTNDQAPIDTTPKPGQSVSAEDTPEYGACEVVGTASIQSALNATSVKNSTSSGIIADNYETAEACSFSYETAQSTDNTLRVRVYLVTASADHQATESFDISWRNISPIPYPEYTLQYPAYFKAIENGGNKEYTLQVISGTRHYQFVVVRPASVTTPDDEAIIKSLLTLASSADYNTVPSTDIPPAPEV